MNFKNIKLTIYYLICCIILFYTSGCIKKNQPIKIGIIGTMSGINSDLSVSGRRGVELAVDEINKNLGINGRKIELVIKDDKNDSNTSKHAYEEFINEKISVVIGPYTSGMIVNHMNYLKNKDILLLGPTISADSLSYTDDNFIRFIASTKEQAEVLTDMATKNNNKNFAVIYDSTNKGFNEALYNNFRELLEKKAGKVTLTKNFEPNEQTSYSDLAKAISTSGTDALFIIANSATNAEITQQIRKIGCKVQIYSPLWSNTTELIKNGGTSIEGMFIVGGIDMDDKKKDFVQFKDNYINKYGEEPTFSSMYSYEAANALFEAIKIGPDFKPSSIKSNIIKIKNFKGLQSNYQIDKFGDNTRKYMIFKIENGQLRKVD